MAGFNFGNAVAGAASAMADVAGDAAKTAIHRNAQIDILKINAEITKDRDNFIATLARDTHRINAETDIGLIGARGKAETGVAVDRADALLPGEIKKAKDTAQARIDIETSPENTAKYVERLKVMAPVEARLKADADLTALLTKGTPEALKATRAIAQASQVLTPGQAAEGELARFKLSQAKLLDTFQSSYADAIASKDPAKANAIVESMAARFFDPAKMKEDAPLKAAVALMGSMDATPEQKAQAGDFITKRLAASVAKIGGSSETGTGPAVGTVFNGHKFKGGNPNDQKNWGPVNGGASSGIIDIPAAGSAAASLNEGGPLPGSPAAGLIASRNERNSAREAEGARISAVEREFDADINTLPVKDLLEKYLPLKDSMGLQRRGKLLQLEGRQKGTGPSTPWQR